MLRARNLVRCIASARAALRSPARQISAQTLPRAAMAEQPRAATCAHRIPRACLAVGSLQTRRYSSTPTDPNAGSSGSADSAVPAQTDGKKKRGIHKNTEKDLWEAVRLLREDNCLDVVTIDVRARSPLCDFFVIATCRAGRHMAAVSETLTQEFKDRRRKGHTLTVEGEPESKWMIVNMSDIQVHLMEESERKRLELEKLWTLGADDDQLRELEDARPDMFI